MDRTEVSENRPEPSQDQSSDVTNQPPSITESVDEAKSKKDELERDDSSNREEGNQNNINSPLNMSEVQALQKEGKIPLNDSNKKNGSENGSHSSGKPNSPNTETTVEREPAKAVPEPETVNTVRATPNTVLITS